MTQIDNIPSKLKSASRLAGQELAPVKLRSADFNLHNESPPSSSSPISRINDTVNVCTNSWSSSFNFLSAANIIALCWDALIRHLTSFRRSGPKNQVSSEGIIWGQQKVNKAERYHGSLWLCNKTDPNALTESHGPCQLLLCCGCERSTTTCRFEIVRPRPMLLVCVYLGSLWLSTQSCDLFSILSLLAYPGEYCQQLILSLWQNQQFRRITQIRQGSDYSNGDVKVRQCASPGTGTRADIGCTHQPRPHQIQQPHQQDSWDHKEGSTLHDIITRVIDLLFFGSPFNLCTRSRNA